MNKLIIALSLACASACVFADSTVGATPSKITTNDWFSAKVDANGLVRSNGSFENSPTAPEFDTVNKKIVIDSELAKPVTFTANAFTSAAKDMAEVTFNLDTAIVPADVRNEASLTGSKVAFAASEGDDSKGYYAWLGSDWVRLSGATPKADGASYDLGVTFKGDKVQFKVDGTALTADSTEWLSYGAGAAVPTTMSIDLVGSGNVASFIGSQLTIEAEIVTPADCGPIEIPEADMKAFDAAKGSYLTVDAFIADPAETAFGSDKFKTTNISVGTAYALGLVEIKDGKPVVKDEGVLKAKAVAESTDSGIKLQLNATPAANTGVNISYKIMEGSTDVATDLTADNIVIPSDKLDTGLKIFKVQAIVSPQVQAEVGD